MKSFMGWVFGGCGAILTLWGGYYCITGGTKTILDPLPLNAMVGGLTGLALLVIGFVWSRD
jgi:energy-converting hydrogenase Eha subunit C